MALLKKEGIVEQGTDAVARLREAGFGRNGNGSGLFLHPAEACFLLGRGAIGVEKGGKKLDAAALAKISCKSDKNFPCLLAVYSHFRKNGQVVRFGPGKDVLRVYERGIGREEGRAQHVIFVLDGKWKADLATLWQKISVAHLLRKELVLAFCKAGQLVFIKVSKQAFD